MACLKQSALLVGAVVCAVPLVLLAQSAADLQNQINDHQAQLEALNKEIAQYEKDLVEVGAKKQTLQTAVNALDISVKQTQAKVRAKQSQIATTELQIQQLGGDIANKELLIAVDSAAIGETIRSLHESDQASLVEMLLSHPSIADVWNDAESIRVIQDSMHGHVESLLIVKDQLTEDKEATEKKEEAVRNFLVNLFNLQRQQIQTREALTEEVRIENEKREVTQQILLSINAMLSQIKTLTEELQPKRYGFFTLPIIGEDAKRQKLTVLNTACDKLRKQLSLGGQLSEDDSDAFDKMLNQQPEWCAGRKARTKSLIEEAKRLMHLECAVVPIDTAQEDVISTASSAAAATA